MSRLALGKRRVLEIALYGAPTEPDLVRDRIQGPALPMVRPDLFVVGHPLRPPNGSKGHRPCGRLRRRKRHGGDIGGWPGGIMHGCWCHEVLGIDPR